MTRNARIQITVAIIGGVFAVGAALLPLAWTRGGEKDEPQPRPNLPVVLNFNHTEKAEKAAEPTPHGRRRLVLGQVEAGVKKKDGSDWDVRAGAPDLKVTIRNVTTGQTQTVVGPIDSHKVDFNAPTVSVAAGDTLEIVVHDADVQSDDTVGTTTFQVTAAVLSARRAELRFEQVAGLQMRFQ